MSGKESQGTPPLYETLHRKNMKKLQKKFQKLEAKESKGHPQPHWHTPNIIIIHKHTHYTSQCCFFFFGFPQIIYFKILVGLFFFWVLISLQLHSFFKSNVSTCTHYVLPLPQNIDGRVCY